MHLLKFVSKPIQHALYRKGTSSALQGVTLCEYLSENDNPYVTSGNIPL